MTDDELLDMVRATCIRHDPIPEHVLASGKAIGALLLGAIDWTWLERLDEPAGVRGPARVLSFADGARAVDLELHRDRAVTGVRGIVTPVSTDARIDVCWPTGLLTAGVDDLGRFDAVGLPTGPLRLVLRCPGVPAAATRWFVA